jgi:hypothetical protein
MDFVVEELEGRGGENARTVVLIKQDESMEVNVGDPSQRDLPIPCNFFLQMQRRGNLWYEIYLVSFFPSKLI